jgi:predicted O-methyltransferase YrrM
MGDIREVDIQLHFKTKYNLPFCLMPFTLPEAKYQNGNTSFFELIIICLICANVKPKRVLEFGTFNGRTTINIASNTPDDAEIITVDLPKRDMKNTKFALEGVNEEDEHDELGYVGKQIKLYQKYDPKIKNKIKQLWMDTAQFPIDAYRKHFDFIFVDASHTYENCLNDTKTAMQCIRDKGYILWHDYNGWPGVTKALDEYYNDSSDKYNYAHIKGTSMVIYGNID